MDEKLRFVARYLDGEKIAALGREFGISRVTGHKIIDRYRESGMEAFTDRSRRPYRQGNQLPFQVVKLIVQLKEEWPNWSAHALYGLSRLKRPGDLYQPSPRPYRGLPDVQYPLHEHTVTVSACGRICFGSKKINPSQVFAGQNVGIKEEDDGIWQVSFMQYEIGYFDLDTCRVEPVDNPFGSKVLTMSPV